MDTVFRKITMVDPFGPEIRGDLVVRKGRIAGIYPCGKAPEAEREIPAEGLTAFPGVIDMHAHLREPGDNPEDIESGTRAAVSGGITTLVAMANTRPPCDSRRVYEEIMSIVEKKASCEVIQAFAGTTGLEGRELSGFPSLDSLKAVSDDGLSVEDSGLLREVFRHCRQKGLVYLSHAEDLSLRRDGVLHEGEKSRELGLPGIPGAAEDIRTYRDGALSLLEGNRLHFCHVSTEESLELIRRFKKVTDKITCEVTPHHFTLCDADIPGDDALYKMNPPLRSAEDREALIRGILDGTVDVIATDHAPHPAEEKTGGFQGAPFGITGFETLIPLSIEILHYKNGVSLSRIAQLLSANPARILGLSGRGRIDKGQEAWLTVVDLAGHRTLTAETLRTKGKNTPFTGLSLRGVPRFTMMKEKLYDIEKDKWL